MISNTTYPGDPTTHLTFPAVYDPSQDSTSLIALASADNICWTPIPGGLVLEPGAAGSDDAGCLFGASGLVELPGDRVGIPYVGYASATSTARPERSARSAGPPGGEVAWRASSPRPTGSSGRRCCICKVASFA